MATHLWNAFLGYAWILRAVSIFSARDSLKGECPNPSAHDQTCFSRLVQKRILFLSFVTPWALTKSVTTAFRCSESYAPVCIFFYGVFQILITLLHVTTFWRRAVTILCFVFSNLSLLHTFATVGDEAFFGIFTCFWAGDLPLPSCSHGYASVECVPRLCLDTMHSLHLLPGYYAQSPSFQRVILWKVNVQIRLPMIRRVVHVWFRNGFYFDLLSHRGHWRRVWPLPFIVRRAMLPFVFSFTAFFKYLLLYFMLLHFDAEQLPSYVLYSVIYLYCTLLRLLAMRPSSGNFPVFEPAICHYHLAVMATHLWIAFLGYAWILRAVSIFSARDSLKGECPNPSAHDQTCFSRLVQKRILLRIFCHTVGTDEECDHCLSLFGRAMLPFVFSFTAFFKNFLLYFMWLHLDAEQLPSYFFLFSKFLIFTAHFCDCWQWGLLREIFLFLSRRFATTILQSWLRICGMRS